MVVVWAVRADPLAVRMCMLGAAGPLPSALPANCTVSSAARNWLQIGIHPGTRRPRPRDETALFGRPHSPSARRLPGHRCLLRCD